MNRFVVVDLETTGNQAQKKDRIIEIGMVVYQDHQIVDTFQQLLDPDKHISRFITHLTGISNEMVMGQPSFDDIAPTVRDLLKDSYFVAHNVPFDLGFLNAEFERCGITPIQPKIIDTVELSRMLLPESSSFKLSNLSEQLNLAHDSPHRALSDAYVTARLLEVLLNKIARLPLTTLKRLIPFVGRLKSDLTAIFEQAKAEHETSKTKEAHALQYDFLHGLAVKKHEFVAGKEEKLAAFGEYLDRFLQAESRPFTGYQYRPGQRLMAEAIFHAFTSQTHAYIEAGTGIGKTLAYLFPAIYFAKQQKETVWVSTYLNQLQSQIVDQELPRLQAFFPFPVQVTVLKGKKHYLNIKRFSERLFDDRFSNYEQLLTKCILLVWLTETATGDIDEIKLPRGGEAFFLQVSCRFDTFLDDTDATDPSFYRRTLRSVEGADLVIVNHALLSHLKRINHEIVDKMQHLIVDEAHHFPSVVEKELGQVLTDQSLQQVITQTQQVVDLSACQDEVTYLMYEYDQLMQLLASTNGLKNYQESVSQVKHQQRLDDPVFFDLAIEMSRRVEHMIIDLIKLSPQLNKHPIVELWMDLKHQLHSFFLTPIDAWYRWVEVEDLASKRRVYLQSRPKAIDASLKALFIDQLKTLVLTSATLSVQGSFNYLHQQFGTDAQSVKSYKIPVDFPIEEQVRLLIPNDFPLMNDRDLNPYIEAVAETVFSLAEITKGRMLILFNSYQMLRKTYFLLKELFEDDYVLIAQGISSGSHERLKKSFQQFDQTILLGTNAFWEGLDLPGDDLECVVITRLPFDSPDLPIVKGKQEDLEKLGKNSFTHLSLPDAVLRFKQGFGRLIRSESDRGIIFVCDDRLMTKRYGKAFIDSIPAVPTYHRRTTECLELTEQFLQAGRYKQQNNRNS
ncbi:ATP-dependent DNA helicase DinG [Streptohalobacillus salinus]|uniref:3'-5' exonuclease DinG n=1 Tax=Streptohalobacillus salinus TaxID=621096 RepID=A0A2V3WHF0_9BACI|nr:ATP-dependent DNA helicase DinG [Streptohalobacillus salinus]PXW91745.1 ATP-dependent DNA helicase DinG [Streptohalobacillus salinus]